MALVKERGFGLIEADLARTIKTQLRALVATGLCGLFAACGDGGAPSGPSPSPTPSPSPSFPAGYVHVMASGQLTSYRIDRATGRLDPTSSQAFGPSAVMTGEVSGRHVYVGNVAGHPQSAIVTLVPDAANGVLSTVSEVETWPGVTEGGWGYLMAGSDRMLGLWSAQSGRHHLNLVASQPMDASGVVRGEVQTMGVEEHCEGAVVFERRQNLLYSGCLGVVTSYSLEPNLPFKPVSELWSCGSAKRRFESLTPLAAVRGVFLAAAIIDEVHTTCTFQGLELDSRAVVGIGVTRAVAFDPVDPSVPAQIAIRVGWNEKGESVSELRLYSLDPGGQLLLQDTRTDGSYPIAVHPSGRLLFGARIDSNPQAPGTLRYRLVVYSFERDGHLRELQQIDQPGWPGVAVTLPAPTN